MSGGLMNCKDRWMSWIVNWSAHSWCPISYTTLQMTLITETMVAFLITNYRLKWLPFLLITSSTPFFCNFLCYYLYAWRRILSSLIFSLLNHFIYKFKLSETILIFYLSYIFSTPLEFMLDKWKFNKWQASKTICSDIMLNHLV